MFAQLRSLPHRVRTRFRRGSAHEAELQRIYQEKEYLQAYSAHTDRRVAEDPHAAVGGMWETIGSLQFDFLKAEGLRPQHSMLDIGCGTLRGGRHFIAYLDASRYNGIDISPEAIRYGEDLVKSEGLAQKAPRLVVSRDKDLRFGEFEGEVFDFLLAQSVFTHLQPEHIEECFVHVGSVMHPRSAFYFTYLKAPQYTQTGLKDFEYPLEHFQELATRYGFQLDDRSAAYPHPRDQQMVRLSRSPSSAAPS